MVIQVQGKRKERRLAHRLFSCFKSTGEEYKGRRYSQRCNGFGSLSYRVGSGDVVKIRCVNNMYKHLTDVY